MKDQGSSAPRHDPRIHVGLRVHLKFGWNSSETLEVSVTDISEHGMHVRSHSPLRLGMDVQTVFENSPQDIKTYHVVWIRESAVIPSAFEMGLELKQ